MTIFFSVGEPSGDLHGANLIRELRARDASVRCVGYGGPRMAAEGAELHVDLTRLAVMGFLRVIGMLPRFLRLASQAERYFRDHRPDAVVLIDFPGFNWHIARLAKKHGVPVVYYGTPQLWAWASWRVRKLRRYVDHSLCKLPFEEPWLRERGCNATYVGHPYFDELRARELDGAFVAGRERPLVTLLPGSRTHEVRANFPTLLAAARKVRERVPDARFAVAAFKPSQARWCQERIDADDTAWCGSPPEVEVNRTPELIEASRCCLAVSGSVSLELLYHTKPTAIVYRVSPFYFWLQKFFRRVRYITLVNLLTAKELFPEEVGVYDPEDPRDAHALMPEYLTAGDCSDRLAGHAVEWLTDDAAHVELVDRMRVLKERVSGGGASSHAAEYVLRAIGDEGSRGLAA